MDAIVCLSIVVVIMYVCWPNPFGWSWGNFPYTMASDPQEKVLQEIIRQRSLEPHIEVKEDFSFWSLFHH